MECVTIAKEINTKNAQMVDVFAVETAIKVNFD